MRHARAGAGPPGGTDHERPLDARGVRTLPVMAVRMAERFLCPEWVLTSDARRTVETAEGLVKMWRHPVTVKRRSALYLAEARTYLDLLAEVPWEVEHVLLIGHNPGLSDLVSQISGAPRAMPTAGVASFEYEVQRISDIGPTVPGRLTDWLDPDVP